MHPGGRMTYGHSMIVDPWGIVLGQQVRGEGVVMAVVDYERLNQIRRNMPCLRHRRIT